MDIFLRVTLAMVALVVAYGCEVEDTNNISQQTYITSYLQSSHSPTLIPESELAETVDINPAFYTTYGDYAFRYISTYYDAGRDALPQIKDGSRATITFELYPTTTGAVSSGTLPTYTNNPYYESYYTAAGLNVTRWDFTPLEVIIGGEHLLESIDECLVGCYQGDLVEIYLTCNMAYGDDVIGLVSQSSALVFICYIESVEN